MECQKTTCSQGKGKCRVNKSSESGREIGNFEVAELLWSPSGEKKGGKTGSNRKKGSSLCGEIDLALKSKERP